MTNSKSKPVRAEMAEGATEFAGDNASLKAAAPMTSVHRDAYGSCFIAAVMLTPSTWKTR